MPVPQNLGNLNRLLAAVLVPNFPALNITAPFCTPDGLSLNFEGETVQGLRQMTGVVQSPEPYQMGVITGHILKTNGLANLYEVQRLTNALIGDVTVIPDSSALAPYQLVNCSIASANPTTFNGTNAEFLVVIRGTYYINQALWGA